jgi:hypothetical protein
MIKLKYVIRIIFCLVYSKSKLNFGILKQEFMCQILQLFFQRKYYFLPRARFSGEQMNITVSKRSKNKKQIYRNASKLLHKALLSLRVI